MNLNLNLDLCNILLLSLSIISNARPNVIVIVIDDLGYADMSCMDGTSKDVKTLAIDALAARGTLFPQSSASAPICNASRIWLMTG